MITGEHFRYLKEKRGTIECKPQLLLGEYLRSKFMELLRKFVVAKTAV